MQCTSYARFFVYMCAIYFVLPQALLAASPIVSADDVLAFTNAERYRKELPILTTNTTLTKVALARLGDLFTRQYFAHETPTGESVADVARHQGYAYITTGENLALGDFRSSKHVVDSWMDSPGHKANILSKKYSEIGIAAGQGVYKGRYTWIVVQVFGLPRSSCPTIDQEMKIKIDSLQEQLVFLKPLLDLRRSLTEGKGLSRTEYNKRVDAYNLAVTIYNSMVNEQKSLVAVYNEDVESFNACLAQKTGSATSSPQAIHAL